MKWASTVLAIGWLACATTAPKGNADYPNYPGGDCSWSVKEGGSECVVAVGGTTRDRKLGFSELQITEGYGEKKWKCGEKREVCGTEIECTCPFPVTAPDGGQ